MNALLSIKPEFSRRILGGSKRFEYRKSIFKESVGLVYMYESAPTMMVVGQFRILRVITDDPIAIWNLTNHASGIEKKRYFDYFRGRTTAHAIEVCDVVRYDSPLLLHEIYDSRPPQSFAYLRPKNAG